jgi:tRNA-splicing ligase RtcB (3'-phosphate/5'-hydroxy nucleic acid ligase)
MTTIETLPYEVIATSHVPIKAWTHGVPFEAEAQEQLRRVAALPFVHKWVAVMPDVHAGMGATIGSVIASKKAVIPAAVGVDIGCGMMAVKTSLRAEQLPDDLKPLRLAIEAAVPHGRTDHGGKNDRGAWHDVPATHADAWIALEAGYKQLTERHQSAGHAMRVHQLGTLGTGNHFIEVCLDEAGAVWVMLHSGSRGIGNKIGTYFIERAKADMRRWFINLPDEDLAYLPEGSELFKDYVTAVEWAQDYARKNRELMMQNTINALRSLGTLPEFDAHLEAVNCHHNYISREKHYGESCIVTRKGAVRARLGELGIIPGSMGAKSFIVRGKGNAESFDSCSHGAGRSMSRTKAKKQFTVVDHAEATAGVECRKDIDVLDETPGAYKAIGDVMAAQADLVEIVHTLKQVVCVKG